MQLILFDKVWQARSGDAELRLVFKFSAKNAEAWTSLYLDVLLNSGGITFTANQKKPDFPVLVDSGLAQILRKHLASCQLTNALKHQSWRDRIWQFKNASKDEEKLVIFRFAKPPQVELSSADLSLLRASPGAMFTKRKNLELNRDEFLFVAIEEFFSDIKKSLPEQEHEKTVPSPTSVDSSRRRSLKRRLKTLTTSLAKYQDEASLAEDEHRLREELTTLRESGYLRPDIGELLQTCGEKLKKIKIKKRIHAQKRQEILESLVQVEAEMKALEDGEVPPNEGRKQTAVAKKHETASQERQAWYRYKVDQAAEILVGRSAKDNDLLTKQAKGHDFWLHVVQGSGSHVILPKKGIKNAKQQSDLLRSAAILAIHHSPARQDRQGEVYCCERRFLRKTKGLPAGKWLVDRADSLYVRYEDEELRLLLEKRL